MNNNKNNFSWTIIGFHWVMALLLFVLFFLGIYMVELNYYDPNYYGSVKWHEWLGLIALLMIVFRVYVRVTTDIPDPIAAQKWELKMANQVHFLMYILMILIPISGYFISTANGDAIKLPANLSLPAITPDIDRMEDIAGNIHKWLSYCLAAIVILHVLAALKHHFLDHDATLMRIFGINK